MPTSRSNKKNVIITIGDPAGIGPEVTLKALASPRVKGLANFLVVGDRFLIDRASCDTGVRFNAALIDLENVKPDAFKYGVINPSFGRAAVRYLDTAVRILARGEADALVTAPINKTSIIAAGFNGFQGHTEYLAAKAGSRDVAMMFVGAGLKITLVTRHIPFRDVSRSLTADKIFSTIAVTHKALRGLFGVTRPKIAVAGLNPHAGEGGAFGNEESRMIVPAIKKASKAFGRIYGPISPDVMFYGALNKKFDACIALYHDQGLIPFKMLYFKDGVNMTVGLPYVRTSPDHGTAFDIAGKGVADPSSMIEAIMLACNLSKSKR